METKAPVIPDVAVKGIATGLCMMAFFNLLWAGIAYGGLKETNWWFLLIAFPALSILFVINAIKLFGMAKYYPKLTSEADLAEEKRMGKWFGIIFGAEGLGIFIGINVVINLGYPQLTIPVLALVVGLHFFPLAKVFKRTIDYYLATWSTIVAVFSIVLTLNKTFSENGTLAFTGVGIAIATSGYGIYMLLSGWALPKIAAN
ncbi:hypothetical protein [Mucilaginibacter sp.]|uniref:hypothetical protein n=1 Tax=Mucilaginibacter sp. TaxID=1882438 RepID=UPI00284F402B|nr:hypothetical protein [Mucilaginibacter sp.]MDR3694587.1 hypothetical protein [Mucilaginibacter sp.]